MKTNKVSVFFKNNHLQNEFKNNGIVSINIVNTQAINALRDIFDSYHKDLDDSFYHRFYVGVHSNDYEYKKNFNDKVAEILDPIYDKIFINYRKLTYCAQIKGTGPNSIFPLHQDWSLVDEEYYTSATVWLTLNDSYVENGALHAIPGSHSFLNSPRAGTIKSKIDHLHTSVLDLMTPYNCKAGTILVFDPRIFHFSPENKTSEPRISIINTIVPINAQVVQYYKNNSNASESIDLFGVEDDFHFHFNDFAENQHEIKPKGIKLKETHYDASPIPLKKFMLWYYKKNNKMKYLSLYLNALKEALWKNQ